MHVAAPTDQELIDFVIREARLIDMHRLDEWLDLFAEDGIYWMPLEWGQTDPRLTASLMYEDKMLLTIRIERLKGNRTFSQKPRSRCHHVLQTPQIDKRDEAEQRIRHLDADALCRDAQRRAAALRRLGDPHADRRRRQAEDQAQARRHRQLRRRVRQHPAFHVTDDAWHRARSAKSYDGVVACVPVTIPYRRYSTNSAHWWIGRALHELVKRAGLRPTDIDGFAVSSFTVGPDTAVGLTQHFGLSPRWLDHIPFGGASGIVALRRAARAVQAGDAEIVACVAGDTNHVDSFRKTLSTFSRFAQDAVYPYGSGGANASFALITKNYMNSYGAKREDFGKLCIAQRDNALSIPHAMMKKKLTLDEYMSARPIADPIHLFDCVMPCAGAEAFLVCREDTAKSLDLPFVRILSTIERHNAFPADPMQVRGGWALDVDELWSMAGLKPGDVDFVETYDDYPVIVMMQLEDLGFCKKGEGPDFVRSHSFTNDGTLSAQHLGRAAFGRAGRRGRRLARPGRGDAPAHRRSRSAPRCPMPRPAWFPASA